MPRLNKAQDSHFYVTHGFSTRGEDVVRNFSLSQEGLNILFKNGFRDGDSFPSELFHELYEQDHIYCSEVAPIERVAPRIDLHQRVREFFNQFDINRSDSDVEMAKFKSIVFDLTRIPSFETKTQMFLDIGMRAEEMPEKFKNILVKNCPGSVVRDFKFLFKLTDEMFEKIRSGDSTQHFIDDSDKEHEIKGTECAKKIINADQPQNEEKIEHFIENLKRTLSSCFSEVKQNGISIEITIKIAQEK
jgi:hypothetical protein